MYLPTEVGTLMPRSSVVYNDSVWLSSRINRNHTEFSFIHGALNLTDIKKLKIKPLSEAVREKSMKIVPVSHEHTEKIIHKATSHPELPAAIIRIYKNDVFSGQ
eukprot:UN34615